MAGLVSQSLPALAIFQPGSACGMPYAPDDGLVALQLHPDSASKRHAAKEGVNDKASFVNADLFESDFSDATVITLFLLPDINIRLRPKILDMKPGTRVVSNSFTMGEWTADEIASAGNGCGSWCTAYLWIVPAKVEGTWELPQGELALKQTFQMVSGTLRSGNVSTPITGRLNGDQISFTAGANQYTGRVNGNVMEGNVGSGGSWKASRAGK